MMYTTQITVNCTFSDEYEGDLKQSFNLPLAKDFEGLMFDDISIIPPDEVLLRKEMYKRIDSVAQNMAFLLGYSDGAVVNSVTLLKGTPGTDITGNDCAAKEAEDLDEDMLEEDLDE